MSTKLGKLRLHMRAARNASPALFSVALGGCVVGLTEPPTVPPPPPCPMVATELWRGEIIDGQPSRLVISAIATLPHPGFAARWSDLKSTSAGSGEADVELEFVLQGPRHGGQVDQPISGTWLTTERVKSVTVHCRGDQQARIVPAVVPPRRASSD